VAPGLASTNVVHRNEPRGKYLIVSSFILPTVIFFNYSTTRDNNRRSALFQISLGPSNSHISP